MAATDKTVIKLKKNSTAVIASSGYADTLPEELTMAGLIMVDTFDKDQESHIADVLYDCSGLSESFVAKLIMHVLWEGNSRKLNIGKVPGKKPKKEKR